MEENEKVVLTFTKLVPPQKKKSEERGSRKFRLLLKSSKRSARIVCSVDIAFAAANHEIADDGG